MITGPLFKWFGSKWSSSKHYPAPKHDTIVEPFAGSAGYSLRHCDRSVFLAERDVHVRRLWWWLIGEAKESDIREIPVDIPEGTDIRTLGLSLGQSLLIKSWQRTNNVGDCWTVSSWGNKPGQWTANTRARVASEFHQIKHWHVTDDAFHLMATHVERNGLPCTWFVDPPYKYNYGYGTSIDYDALGEKLQRLPGQLIVCEAACQKTGTLPTWLPFVDFRRTVTSRRKSSNNHHSRELIYVREG